MARVVRPRHVHVECVTSAGWRWLKGCHPGASMAPDGGFLVHDEHRWALCLQAAGGKEVK